MWVSAIEMSALRAAYHTARLARGAKSLVWVADEAKGNF